MLDFNLSCPFSHVKGRERVCPRGDIDSAQIGFPTGHYPLNMNLTVEEGNYYPGRRPCQIKTMLRFVWMKVETDSLSM